MATGLVPIHIVSPQICAPHIESLSCENATSACKPANIAYRARGSQNDCFISKTGKFVKVSRRGATTLQLLGTRHKQFSEFLKEKDELRDIVYGLSKSAESLFAYPSKFWASPGTDGCIRLCSEASVVMGESMLLWASRCRALRDIVSVEAQLLGVLMDLMSAGVMHNDFHANNVVVVKKRVRTRRVSDNFVVQSRYCPVLVDWDKAGRGRDSHVCNASFFVAIQMFGGACHVGDAVDYVARNIVGTQTKAEMSYPSFMPALARHLGAVPAGVDVSTSCIVDGHVIELPENHLLEWVPQRKDSDGHGK